MAEPVPIDYTVDVPTNVIGHCCYWDKCVLVSRVRGIEHVALRLIYRKLFELGTLRSFGAKVSGTKTARAIKSLLTKYILLRRGGLSHEEAFRYISKGLDNILNNSSTVKYVEDSIKHVFEDAEKIVRTNIARMPSTGWRILSDDTYTLDLLFFPPAYMFRILSFALRLPRIYTHLVFCSESACYPVPRGLWPDASWIQLVGQALRHDVYHYFLQEFGATNISEYLTNIDTEEVAVSIKPGIIMAKVTLYILVDDPVKHVITIAKMQKTVEKVTEQLEKLILYELKQKEEQGIARSVLGITDDEIARIVEEVIEKRKKGLGSY